MSNTEPVVRRFIELIERQEFHDAFSLLADDGKYIIVGTTPASRTYHGKKDFFDNLVPLLTGFVVAPSLKFQEPIIAGDRAAVIASGAGVGQTGPYHQPYYCFMMQVRGEEFSEVYEFFDTVMLETALFGKQLVAR